VTLTASQAAIASGGSVTLQWQAQNATSVQIDPGIGTVATSGNRSVSPTSSVTYTATATGPGGTATASARVTVNAPAPPPSTGSAPPAVSMEEMFRTNVQTVYFDYDRADIRPDQVAHLQASARFLSQNATLQFTVSGHADERGSQEYNIGLGDRRANAVRQFLVAQGVPASRIETVSFGEERPVCTQSGETCWSQNRRGAFALR
jgi:peptidoglycan-associated lipoprotein